MPKKKEEKEAEAKVEVEVLSQPTKLDKDMLMTAFTDKDARAKMLRDETLEPHIHLAALLLIVFALAVFIMVLY